MTASRVYPEYRLIIGITNALNAQVDFATTHDFTPGENVAFRVSKPFGMVEINEKVARVLSIDSTSVVVELDTLSFTPFIYPPVEDQYSPAMLLPSSSGIIPDLYPSTVNLEDSFDRIRVQ